MIRNSIMILLIVIIPLHALGGYDEHQRNILPGGRAAAMGGAYTALSHDPSGTVYNPAGLAFAKDNEISLSVNSYNRSDLVYHQTIGTQNYKTESNAIFPAFIGALYKYDSVTLAWSYLTKDAKSINQNDQFKNLQIPDSTLSDFTIQHLETNNLTWGGGSIAIDPISNFSLGLSIFYYYHDMKLIEHQQARFQGESFILSNSRVTASNNGVVTILGSQVKMDSWTFGLTGQIPSPLSDSGIIYQNVTHSTEGQPVQNISSEMKTSDFEEITPTTLGIGVAKKMGSNFTLSSDILHHFWSYPQKNQGSHKKYIDTTNYALGAEFVLKPILLRCGAFSNNAMTPRVNPTNKSQPNHINYLGYSAAIGYQKKGLSIDIIASQQKGVGKGQIIAESTDVQQLTGSIESLSLTIGYTN